MTQPDRSLFPPLLRRGTSLLCLAAALFAVVLTMAGKSTLAPAASDEARVLTSLPLTAAGAFVSFAVGKCPAI